VSAGDFQLLIIATAFHHVNSIMPSVFSIVTVVSYIHSWVFFADIVGKMFLVSCREYRDAHQASNYNCHVVLSNSFMKLICCNIFRFESYNKNVMN